MIFSSSLERVRNNMSDEKLLPHPLAVSPQVCWSRGSRVCQKLVVGGAAWIQTWVAHSHAGSTCCF